MTTEEAKQRICNPPHDFKIIWQEKSLCISVLIISYSNAMIKIPSLYQKRKEQNNNRKLWKRNAPIMRYTWIQQNTSWYLSKIVLCPWPSSRRELSDPLKVSCFLFIVTSQPSREIETRVVVEPRSASEAKAAFSPWLFKKAVVCPRIGMRRVLGC